MTAAGRGRAGPGSGYLVRVGGTVLVLDAGPGTFAVLQTLVDPSEVDAVVISHHHPDHWTDLYAMDTQARFGGRRGAAARLRPGRGGRRGPGPSAPRASTGTW